MVLGQTIWKRKRKFVAEFATISSIIFAQKWMECTFMLCLDEYHKILSLIKNRSWEDDIWEVVVVLQPLLLDLFELLQPTQTLWCTSSQHLQKYFDIYTTLNQYTLAVFAFDSMRFFRNFYAHYTFLFWWTQQKHPAFKLQYYHRRTAFKNTNHLFLDSICVN